MSTNKTVKRTAPLAVMILAALLVYGFGGESMAGVSGAPGAHAEGYIDAYTGARSDFDAGWMTGLTATGSAVPTANAFDGIVWATTVGSTT